MRLLSNYSMYGTARPLRQARNAVNLDGKPAFLPGFLVAPAFPDVSLSNTAMACSKKARRNAGLPSRLTALRRPSRRDLNKVSDLYLIYNRFTAVSTSLASDA